MTVVTGSGTNVLIVFYTRRGATERLATAAALGALQRGANIRLRRLAGRESEDTISADPLWRQMHDRLQRDYITPRPIDSEWAHAVIVATPSGAPEAAVDYLRGIAIDAAAPTLALPLAGDGDAQTLERLFAAAAGSGLIVVPPRPGGSDPLAVAREDGRRVTVMAAALRGLAGESPV